MPINQKPPSSSRGHLLVIPTRVILVLSNVVSPLFLVFFKWRHKNPKSQGLLRFYLHLVKDLLKINLCASFQRDSVFRFENIALFNFDINMAWYYTLWMVKVLENVFRGIIFSLAVNNWSNLWQYWPPYLCSFKERKYGVPIVSPINFCYTIWGNTQQRKTA